MKKRMLALLLTLCMVISLLPAQAVVAEGTDGEQTVVTWEIQGLSATATAGQTVTATVVASDGNPITENVSWTSSDLSVAMVMPNPDDMTTASVNFIKAGTVTISVTNGSVEESVAITVTDSNSGEANLNTVTFVTYNSSFTVTTGEESDTFESFGYAVPAGKTMGDYVTISDPVNTDSTQFFAGWFLYRWNAETEDFEMVPDTGSFDTAAALNYQLAEGERVLFQASWSSDDPNGGGTEPGGGDSATDLGVFPLDTAVHVSGTCVATFTPKESGYYTIYQVYDNEDGYQWMSIDASADGEYVNCKEWYAPAGEGETAQGFRWHLEGGKTYDLTFNGSPWGNGITFTLRKAVAPTAIAFTEDNYLAYVGIGYVEPVAFTPFYAYGEVTYTSSSPNVFDMDANGEQKFQSVGEATLTATCGSLSDTAKVTVRNPRALTLDQEVTEQSSSDTRAIFTFTPDATGEYTFTLMGENAFSAYVENTAEDEFVKYWSVDAGVKVPSVVELTEGVTYKLGTESMYPKMNVTAKVTAGSNVLTMTPGNALSVNVPANAAVSVEYVPAESGEYVLYWPIMGDGEDGPNFYANVYGISDMGQEMRFSENHYSQNAEGLRFFMEQGTTYLFTLYNRSDEAKAFSLNVKPATTDTGIAFRPNPQSVHHIGDEEELTVVPVEPNGIWGTISWQSSNEAVATVETGDNTQWGYVRFVGEGEVTITATNSNGEKASHTYQVVDHSVPVFGIPDDATVTAMVKDTKYDVPADEPQYFTFTASAAGVYSLNTDAAMGVGGECNVIVNGLAEAWIFNGENMGVYLEKDQTVELFAYAETACKLWLAKEASITKMEIVRQDKTSTYVVNEGLNPRFTLKDVELKLTYEDGTTEQINGIDMYRYEYMPYYNGMPLHVEMVIDSTTATVFFTCAGVQVEYEVKLDAAMVTKFEVIPAADMIDIYENTMGWEEEGVFAYYDAISLAFSVATYKFTWSDGTVETFTLPWDGEAEYHGVELMCGVGVDYTGDPWTVGINSVPVTYGELSDTLDIEIKANNVDSIEILDLGVTEYVLGDPDYFANNEDGWYMINCDLSGFQLKVNYTDGTSKTFTEEDITDFRGFYSLLNNTPVDGYPVHMPYTTTGTAKVYMAYMGAEDAFDVKLVDAVVDNGNIIVPETAVDEALEDKQGDTVTLDVTTNATTEAEQTSSVKLPVVSVEKLVEEEVKQVVVEMDSATVTLDTKALEAIAEQAEGASITLSVEQVATTTLTEKQQAVLKDKDVDLVLTALVLSDGEPIGDFKGGSVTVAVPFELPAGDNAEDYNVWYVANDGTMEKMDTSYADGMLLFITKHFSDYVVIKTTQTNEEDKDNSGIGESTPEPEDPTQPTEPKPTEPKPTEPKPTEPKPTEPKPTEPKPTEPTKPTNPAVPDTADTADIMGLMTLMLVSGAMAMALWLSLRKRNAA